MKIDSREITCITIYDIEPNDGEFGSLDPISITLTNDRPDSGEIIIKCYNKAWTAGWGGMSGKSVEKFFVDCDDGYLIKNLSPGIEHSVRIQCPNWLNVIKTRIIELRRDGCLCAEDARERWNDAVNQIGDYFDPTSDSSSILCSFLGDGEWWEYWPHEPNPEYVYLKRIVQAVRKGLKQWMEASHV